MKHSETLWSPAAGHSIWNSLWQNVVKPALVQGKRVAVDLREPSKSRKQEEKYHAMIGEIAEQARHLGSTWDAESWKRLLLDSFAKETKRPRGKVIPNLDGDGVVEVGLQSRKFSVSDGSEFVEWLTWWGTENGVTFSDQR